MGGGIGMGNTCKPMAVLFQCMTKFTTNKKKKKKDTLYFKIENKIYISQKKKKKTHGSSPIVGNSVMHLPCYFCSDICDIYLSICGEREFIQKCHNTHILCSKILSKYLNFSLSHFTLVIFQSQLVTFFP